MTCYSITLKLLSNTLNINVEKERESEREGGRDRQRKRERQRETERERETERGTETETERERYPEVQSVACELFCRNLKQTLPSQRWDNHMFYWK